MTPESPNPTPTTDVAAWFQNVDNPAPSAATPPPQKKNHRMALIIILSSLLGLACIGTVIFTVLSKTAPCLTAADYAALTGTKLDSASLSPTTDFYTSSVAFKPGTVAFNETSTENASGTALLKKIATFYAEHAESSIAIAIKGTYLAEDALTLTEERIKAVQDYLISNGVPASVVIVNDPEYIVPEEEVPENTSSVLISITSNEQCT